MRRRFGPSLDGNVSIAASPLGAILEAAKRKVTVGTIADVGFTRRNFAV
jgi:hypothetical protein